MKIKCLTNPGNKSYKIIHIPKGWTKFEIGFNYIPEDYWECYPETEEEILELFLCYNGITMPHILKSPKTVKIAK